MTSIPAFTLSKLLAQQAVIERDMAQDDRFGGQSKPVWRPHLTVPCRLWWDRSAGTRSANRTYESASREVPISAGGMLLALGTDVTEQDRIARVLTGDGSLLIDGIFEIVAVLNEFSHLELEVQRASLGA